VRSYVLTARASRDLSAIIFYVAEDSRSGAARPARELRAGIRFVTANPGVGHRRRDLGRPALRVWSVHSYLIIYDPRTDPLRVIRVIHGARDVRRAIGD